MKSGLKKTDFAREDVYNMTKADISTSDIAKQFLKKPYSRILIPEEDGRCSAEILEFPGCYSQGDTVEEAMANIDDAAQNWIETMLEAGKPIPPPSTDYEYAGKVALRLPRSTHRQAIRMAQRDGVSLNQWLVSAISARVGAEELFNRIAERAETTWVNKALTAESTWRKFVTLMKQWRELSDTTDNLVEEGTGISVPKLVWKLQNETMEIEG